MDSRSLASINISDFTTPKRMGEPINSHVIKHFARSVITIAEMQNLIDTQLGDSQPAERRNVQPA